MIPIVKAPQFVGATEKYMFKYMQWNRHGGSPHWTVLANLNNKYLITVS